MLKAVDYFDDGACARSVPVMRVRAWPAPKPAAGYSGALAVIS